MKLIDADELMELYDGLEDKGLVIPVDVVVQNIKDMPTAYDVKSVLEQLEERKQEEGNVTLTKIAYNTAIEDAIEIVKSGGKV